MARETKEKQTKQIKTFVLFPLHFSTEWMARALLCVRFYFEMALFAPDGDMVSADPAH